VVHSTATKGASARAIYRWFSRSDSPPASYHVVCDWNESLVLVPCYPGACEVAYHAGPKANPYYLSVSACESEDLAQNVATYQRLLKVVRGLLWLWEISPYEKNVVVSHDWVSKNLGGTDHSDPIAWLKSVGRTWDQFLKELQETRI
jgi:N-acetylmuramoyl-L-alanine amidase